MNRTAEYTKKLRAAKRKSGLCYYCNEKVEKGRSLCTKHLTYNRNKMREYLAAARGN